MTSFTINGITAEAQEGQTVLQVAREADIEILILCHHDAQPLWRLQVCVVEVQKGTRTRIVTSWNYPAENGLAVQTIRKEFMRCGGCIELLLARCPNVKVIRELAEEYGLKEPRLKKAIISAYCAASAFAYAGKWSALKPSGLPAVVLTGKLPHPFFPA